MSNLRLVQPSIIHIQDVMAYRQEFLYEEKNVVEGATGLGEASSYQDWF